MNNRIPFALNPRDLTRLYYSNRAVEEALHTISSQDFTCSVDMRSEDSFGAYATGRRCYLQGVSGGRTLYAYAGSIYSDEKTSGYFAEIDEYSNPSSFSQISASLREDGHFTIDRNQAGFLKLFMKPEDYAAFGDFESNVLTLRGFFATCFKAFVSAAN